MPYIPKNKLLIYISVSSWFQSLLKPCLCYWDVTSFDFTIKLQKEYLAFGGQRTKGTQRIQQVRNSHGWLLLAQFTLATLQLGTGTAWRQSRSSCESGPGCQKSWARGPRVPSIFALMAEPKSLQLRDNAKPRYLLSPLFGIQTVLETQSREIWNCKQLLQLKESKRWGDTC